MLRKVVRVKGIENCKMMAKEARKREYKFVVSRLNTTVLDYNDINKYMPEKLANGQKIIGCVSDREMLFWME